MQQSQHDLLKRQIIFYNYKIIATNIIKRFCGLSLFTVCLSLERLQSIRKKKKETHFTRTKLRFLLWKMIKQIKKTTETTEKWFLQIKLIKNIKNIYKNVNKRILIFISSSSTSIFFVFYLFFLFYIFPYNSSLHFAIHKKKRRIFSCSFHFLTLIVRSMRYFFMFY